MVARPFRFDVQRGLTRLSLGAGGTSAESSVGGLASLGGAASGQNEDDDLGTFRQALAFSGKLASKKGQTGVNYTAPLLRINYL